MRKYSERFCSFSSVIFGLRRHSLISTFDVGTKSTKSDFLAEMTCQNKCYQLCDVNHSSRGGSSLRLNPRMFLKDHLHTHFNTWNRPRLSYSTLFVFAPIFINMYNDVTFPLLKEMYVSIECIRPDVREGWKIISPKTSGICYGYVGICNVSSYVFFEARFPRPSENWQSLSWCQTLRIRA